MVTKNICVVQGRLGSKRFPNKILLPLSKNLSILQFLIRRLNKSKKINKIIFATAINQDNSLIKKTLSKEKCEIFFGDQDNVLKRFYESTKKYKCDNIVRITADCPFVDYKIVDKMLNIHEKKNLDFIDNIKTFPDGMDIEIFKFRYLKEAYKNAKTKHEKEHVTPYIKNKTGLKFHSYDLRDNYSNLRLTLDYPEDYELIKKLYKKLTNIKKYGYLDIIKIMKNNKKIREINKKFIKVDGSKISLSQKVWNRAKKIIPGGNMLLSKRPEMFLPNLWPTYFEKAKGCSIWDLSNKKYLDLSLMGVGTNILGYSNPRVDNQVMRNLLKGNMTTFNCEEEVLLSEKLIEKHPWFQMVKLARSGGEANSIAIRIARAYNNKQNVAICGYHGWHDWYLASNLNNKNNLNEHLLQNLPIKGVNNKLINTVFPFKYNDLETLKKIIKNKNIGIIKMEVQRNIPPKNNFLHEVRKLANKNKIVLIFDECTTGFRLTDGGLHKKYKVYPDICILGKALGNGYAINAVMGKKEIMKSAEDTFISSTFWTERIGPTAALSTIKEMDRIKSWEIIKNRGKSIKSEWKSIAKSTGVDIEISGIDSLPQFKILDEKYNYFKTYITQEMLKKGILATTTIYVSTSHTDKVLNIYFKNLKNIFKRMKKIKIEKNIEKYLNTEPAMQTFKRMN